ncbi:MAG TPA: precorrin-6A reductase [Candidatus Avacidaminococcus intestinavium]|uniref:Precorrin-6A reductase n=1 Tax=Candidatus Avacidaminococcus intestinavium TaxID=2840684 RepID=A0A9D1MR91_9FIRM|nr:precorrin-6A reductase [Candidatus Avacidaminococcus intestinavium]
MTKKPVIWIIAGTSEGRRLIEALATAELEIVASVATEYGAQLIPAQDNLTVLQGRMDQAAMEGFLTHYQPALVVDATHPYAVAVTETIKNACLAKKCEFLRLLRPLDQSSAGIKVNSYEEAAEYLAHTTGKIFLATGSNTLDIFTKIPDFANRLVIRILPMRESLDKALRLGYKPQNIICMQGPFSTELNLVMFKHIKAKFVVTKESGSVGGFPEKEAAAHQSGAALVVIGRNEELGSDFEQVLQRLWQLSKKN